MHNEKRASCGNFSFLNNLLPTKIRKLWILLRWICLVYHNYHRYQKDSGIFWEWQKQSKNLTNWITNVSKSTHPHADVCHAVSFSRPITDDAKSLKFMSRKHLSTERRSQDIEESVYPSRNQHSKWRSLEVQAQPRFVAESLPAFLSVEVSAHSLRHQWQAEMPLFRHQFETWKTLNPTMKWSANPSLKNPAGRYLVELQVVLLPRPYRCFPCQPLGSLLPLPQRYEYLNNQTCSVFIRDKYKPANRALLFVSPVSIRRISPRDCRTSRHGRDGARSPWSIQEASLGSDHCWFETWKSWRRRCKEWKSSQSTMGKFLPGRESLQRADEMIWAQFPDKL